MEESLNLLIQKLWIQAEKFVLKLPSIIIAILILAIIWNIAQKISRLLRNRLKARAHDQLFTIFVSNLTRYAIMLLGIMIAFQLLGLSGIAGGLLAGAGVSALIFGFAFKDIGENFLSGIILAFNRPFSLNDTIKIKDFMGRVEALNFRTTHIKTFDEKDVFIPNSTIIKEVLTNLTRDGMLRLEFVIGIAYEDDITKALDLIVRTVTSVDELMKEPIPFAVIDDFAASTVNIRVFFWTSTDDYRRGVLITKSYVMSIVKEQLLKNKFSLPANVQELKVYEPQKALPVYISGPPTNSITGNQK